MRTPLVKTTVAELMDPLNSGYDGSVGTYAYLLSKLMKTDGPYRGDGQWGSSGVREILSGYPNCTGCGLKCWHSNRRLGVADRSHVNHVRGIRDCILGALCRRDELFDRWRSDIGLHLFSEMRLPERLRDSLDSEHEWQRYVSHYGRRWRSSLNGSHPRARTLRDPQLIIGANSVRVGMDFTYKPEPRGWRLFDEDYGTGIDPVWHVGKELFSEFLCRVNDQIEKHLA